MAPIVDNDMGRLRKLCELIAEKGGDVAAAVRAMTGRSTTDLAERVDLPRRSVEQCLSLTGGRRYPHVRVALEVELGIPPGTIGPLIDAQEVRASTQ